MSVLKRLCLVQLCLVHLWTKNSVVFALQTSLILPSDLQPIQCLLSIQVHYLDVMWTIRVSTPFHVYYVLNWNFPARVMYFTPLNGLYFYKTRAIEEWSNCFIHIHVTNRALMYRRSILFINSINYIMSDKQLHVPKLIFYNNYLMYVYLVESYNW